MKNRTKSASWRIALAAILVAFSLSGCDTGAGPDLRDLCPGVPGDQYTLPCPSPKISVVTSFPTANPSVIQGEVLPCPNIAISIENLPSGAGLDTLHTLKDGRTTVCGYVSGVGPQMLADSPVAPVSTVVEVGENTLTTTITLRGTAIKAVSQPLTFTVVEKPKPDYIVTTCISGGYPDRGPGEVCMAEDTTNAKVVRLTNTGGSKAFSAVSPDLSYMLYVLWEDQGLYRANMDGNNAVRYTLVWQGKTLRPRRIVISPNSQKVAFMAVIEGESTYSAFVMNADGTGLKRLLADKGFLMPDLVWMPNGQEVVLGHSIGNEYGDVLQWIYVLQNVATDEIKTLLTVNYGEEKLSLSIMDASPDGKWMMLWDDFGRTTNPQGVFLVRTDGSGEVKVVPGAVWMPTFCPNGREICSIKKINGGQVVSMDLNGQNIRDRFTVGSGWIDRLYRVNVVR